MKPRPQGGETHGGETQAGSAKVWLIAALVAQALVALWAVLGSQRAMDEREPDRLNRQVTPDRLVLTGVIPPAPTDASQADPSTGSNVTKDASTAPKPADVSPTPVVTPPNNAATEPVAAKPSAAPTPSAPKPDAAELALADAQARAEHERAAARTQATQCVEVTRLNAAALQGLQAQLRNFASAKSELAALESPADQFMVMIPPPANASRDTARTTVQALKSAGVRERDIYLIDEPGVNFLAISLGVFKKEDNALEVAQGIRQKGFSTVQVLPRRQPGAERLSTLTVRGLTLDQARSLKSSAKDFPRSEWRECSK